MGTFGDQFEREVLLAQREESQRRGKRYCTYAAVLLVSSVLLIAFRGRLFPVVQYALHQLPDEMQRRARWMFAPNSLGLTGLAVAPTIIAIVEGLFRIYDRVRYGPKR